MLKTEITVDLPSAETDRRMRITDRILSFFGKEIDLRSGKEALTIEALKVIENLVAAFAEAGFSDAISLLVDKRVVYKDVEDQDDDLGLILEAVRDTGIPEKGFDEMHLVMTRTVRDVMVSGSSSGCSIRSTKL